MTTTSHIQFTNTTTRKGDTPLRAVNPAVAKLAHAIIHRIEQPDGAQPATTQARSATFGKRKVGRGVYRTGMVRPREFSREDMQDAFQTVHACLAQFPPDPAWNCPFRQVIKPQGETGIPYIFRTVRDLLRMNGGNHDRARCDSLDLAMEQGRDFAMPHNGDDEQAVPATLRDDLEAMAARAHAADTSRQRDHAFKSALSLIAYFCGENTGHVFEKDASQKARVRLRLYLSKGCEGGLARERAKAFPAP